MLLVFSWLAAASHFYVSKPLKTFYTNKGDGFLINEATTFISNEVFNP